MDDLPAEILWMILREKVDPVDRVACRRVSRSWEQTLRCRHTHGHSWSATLYTEALAERGWLDVLRWASADGCEWDGSACERAAEGGHLAVLKWLRANDCPWDRWTCAKAAKSGHLEVIDWARANGCPWDEYACAHAAPAPTWRCSGGSGPTAARGIREHACAPRVAVT